MPQCWRAFVVDPTGDRWCSRARIGPGWIAGLCNGSPHPGRADISRRIKDLTQQWMPRTPSIGEHLAVDLACWSAPRYSNALVKLGVKRLAEIIAKASANKYYPNRRINRRSGVGARVVSGPSSDRRDRRRDRTQVGCCAVETERARHAAAREDRYMVVDPDQLARSIPGFSTIGGPALVACMGDPARFAKGKQFRSFSGLTPKASETGNTDRKDKRCPKPHRPPPRRPASCAASCAPTRPQLLRIYYVQMVERGKNHLEALCAVAANLAERLGLAMPPTLPTSSATSTAHRSPTSSYHDHRRPLDRSRRGPSPPTQRQDNTEGEGPQAVSTRQPKPHANGAGKTATSPTNIINPTLASNQDPRRVPLDTEIQRESEHRGHESAMTHS